MAATKPEKKEKKDKKRSEADGVTKPGKDKKEKKEKKEKKDKLKTAVNAALDDQLQADAAAQEAEASDSENEGANKPVVGALVPFALPLADDKATKKLLKTVRKGKEQVFIPPSAS
jgi:H/ACA ribonucleoprotein complex subunit 2